MTAGRMIVGTFLATVLVMGSGLEGAKRSEAVGVPQQSTRATLRVLFVGNSYTGRNNLPAMVEAVALSKLDGPLLSATAMTRGGATLRRHIDSGEAMTAIDSDAWDVVILQDATLFGAPIPVGVMGDPAVFQGAVRELVPRIRARKATPLLFMHYARRAFPEQQAAIRKAYIDVASELKIPVARVGDAWADARAKVDLDALFAPDGLHPSLAGSYLCALVIYDAITGKDSRGTAVPTGVDVTTAAALQEIAARVRGKVG